MVMVEEERALSEMVESQPRPADTPVPRDLTAEQRTERRKQKRAEQRERIKNRNQFVNQAEYLLGRFGGELTSVDGDPEKQEISTPAVDIISGGENVQVKLRKFVDSSTYWGPTYATRETFWEIRSLNPQTGVEGPIFQVIEGQDQWRNTPDDKWIDSDRTTVINDKFGARALSSYVAVAPKAVNHIGRELARQHPQADRN